MSGRSQTDGHEEWDAEDAFLGGRASGVDDIVLGIIRSIVRTIRLDNAHFLSPRMLYTPLLTHSYYSSTQIQIRRTVVKPHCDVTWKISFQKIG